MIEFVLLDLVTTFVPLDNDVLTMSVPSPDLNFESLWSEKSADLVFFTSKFELVLGKMALGGCSTLL